MRKTFAIVFFLLMCLTHTAGFGYAAFDVTGRATASPPSRSASIATGGLPSAVTNAAGLAELHAYTYDPAGNRLTAGSAASTYTVFETYEYDAWGNVLAVRDASGALLAASAAGNRFLFQGREYSHATGLHNFRARWYDPSSARWLSPDPIGLEGGLNLYEFCRNNPVNYIDPYGLDVWGWLGKMTVDADLTWLEIWGAWDEGFKEGFKKGLVAGIDGFIPFVDPFESFYADECGEVDDMYRVSRHIGGFTRDAMLAVAVPNIGTWIKNPVMYELGSTTVSPTTWNAIKGMDTVSRGKYLLAEAGGGVGGWWKASVQGFKNASQFGTTMKTGPTPGGGLGLIGIMHGTDAYYSR